MYIFTLYDTTAKKAGPLFVTSTIGEAERQFKDAISRSDKASLISSHPECFQLTLLGEFDDNIPQITSTDSRAIVTGTKLDSEGK